MRRSCLAVPASDRRKIESAARSAADEVFLDLEDACAPSEKVEARQIAVDALTELQWTAKTRVVRINDVTTQWCHDDIVALRAGSGAALDLMMVPKVDDASHVHFVDHLLNQVEAELGDGRRMGLEVQIESPAGAVNLAEIVRASSRIDTVVFGPGDYAAALGIAQFEIGMIDPDYPGHQWHWVMCQVVNHARAAGLRAMDGPYVDFNDEAGFRESAMRARRLGFDGKWCIHPNQIAWGNEVFSPTQSEYEQAERLLAAYAAAWEQGRGAIAVEGKLVDEATRKMAERVADRGRALRLTSPAALSDRARSG